MRIHILSDLHNEFEPYHPYPVDADVIVLAGDIHTQGRAVKWASDAFGWFDGPILFVAGNHDYYGATIDRAQARMREEAAKSNGRVHFLERDSVVINGVRFLGATAWTDYELRGNTPLAMFDAQRMMNDHHKIRIGAKFQRWLPEHAAATALETKRWLMTQLAATFDGPTVLITHHPICKRSLDPARPKTLLDAAYASDWEHLFGKGLDLVIHGHTHHAVDYVCHGTRVVSNPRGYPGEGTGFDSKLIVDPVARQATPFREGKDSADGAAVL